MDAWGKLCRRPSTPLRRDCVRMGRIQQRFHLFVYVTRSAIV